jgi:UDP-2,3-diacylglucosamine pyrophosphatase LpxH
VHAGSDPDASLNGHRGVASPGAASAPTVQADPAHPADAAATEAHRHAAQLPPAAFAGDATPADLVQALAPVHPPVSPEPDDLDTRGKPKLQYRTVWISDVHLGIRDSKAKELNRFLKRIECDTLYLVGDLIDMWRLRQRWYWPTEHNDIIRRLLKMAKGHTRVVFIPGNHDEAARGYVDMEFGGVEVKMNDVHETADGRRLLITHGDQYDMVVKHSRLLSILGAIAYEWLIKVNRVSNRIRSWFGLPYWSLSHYIKLKVKSACTFISKYEKTLIHEAKRRDLDGVVCGHIHKAEILDDGEIQYFNSGDWVESCTALIERHDGEMEIVDGLAAVEVVREAREAKRLKKAAKRARKAGRRAAEGEAAETARLGIGTSDGAPDGATDGAPASPGDPGAIAPDLPSDTPAEMAHARASSTDPTRVDPDVT